MADIDLDQDHVRAGAEALQREDWAGNHPLIHYIPTAETVLEAVAELTGSTSDPVEDFLAQDGLRQELIVKLQSYDMEWHSDDDIVDGLLETLRGYEP